MKNHLSALLADRSVLITGVCGTVGKELLRQVSAFAPSRLVGLDNNESELFFLAEEYRDRPEVDFYLCDLRDRDQIQERLRGIEIVLHTAALKHVGICENSPQDAVRTNILGTQNIIDAAIKRDARRVLFTSSDKAVNPTNVMGASKLMGERLMTAASAAARGGGPIFASTRFGNVLGSRGSVIPLFKRQIESGGPVTLTDPAMTRFVMTLSEAVHLVMQSLVPAQGGEVFVTKMRSIRIVDLAAVMIEELAPQNGFDPSRIEVRVVGSRPGEKMYEELMNTEETRRTIELEDFFVVLPALRASDSDAEYRYEGEITRQIDRPYNSALEEPMELEELRSFLRNHQLLGPRRGTPVV